MVQIASAEVGTTETGDNITKYGTWYGSYGDWCSVFVSWCANQCNIPESVIPKTAGCLTMRSHFESLNRFYYSAQYGGTVQPAVGDIFVRGGGKYSAAHVGIIVSISGDNMYVVDGNCENKVNYHSFSKTHDEFVGFMRPSYAPGHTLGAWNYDGSNHWKECSHCGYRNTAAHTLKLVAGAYTCATCGYNSKATVNCMPPEKMVYPN